MNGTQPRREFLTQSVLAFIASVGGGGGAAEAAPAAHAGTGLRRSRGPGSRAGRPPASTRRPSTT